MKVYLVTGGAGFIGSNIVAALVKDGKRVRVLDNFSTGRQEFLRPFKSSIHIMEGDIRRFKDCQKAVKGVSIVFHQAALRSVPKSVVQPFVTHDIDATGTLNMLQASKEAGVDRFVYASSSSVYGDVKRFPMKEDDPVKPLSPYGVAKFAGELYAYSYYVNYGLETVSLRYFNVFGPHQNAESKYSAAVPAFIDLFYHNKSPIIYGDGRQSRDFTYIENVVNANLLAAKVPAAKGHVFNVASGRDYSVLELYRELAKIMRKTNLKPVFEKRRPSDPDRTIADVSKVEGVLGLKPSVDFRQGLEKTVLWFLE